DPFEAATRHVPPFVNSTTALSAETVVLVTPGLQCYMRNSVQYWYADDNLVLVDPNVTTLPSPVVIGPATWPEAEAVGATRVPFTVWLDWGVWVFPTDDE